MISDVARNLFIYFGPTCASRQEIREEEFAAPEAARGPQLGASGSGVESSRRLGPSNGYRETWQRAIRERGGRPSR